MFQDNASLRGKSESLRSNAGTIRFEVPHPKKQEEVIFRVGIFFVADYFL